MANRPETNYFVCTLGEAVHETLSKPFSTINQLLREQAELNGDQPALGLYITSKTEKELTAKCLTFKELSAGVAFAENSLKSLLQYPLTPSRSKNVSLLMESSPNFLFTWLGLIQLGYSVLLIAPQLPPAAIAHLCHVCEVDTILADNNLFELASKACEPTRIADGSTKIRPVESEIELDELWEYIDSRPELKLDNVESLTDGVAYIHHTSGTSSGLPKPIPQTHHGAVGVVPILKGQQKATFTTTPLYHGGPADIFRAWASCALIWLFPSHAVPITASNVRMCLEVSKGVSKPLKAPIKYFTSVPYVLQMMAADEQGLTWLKSMDLVGVGGAALSPTIGDSLVSKGIDLVSRFGSAECGFLMSSHRDYEEDKSWQFLRHCENSTQITFEEREGGLYELIVKSNWPHMAKRNRQDGSFATSDLFEPHASIAGAWRYHSRADAQITLATGKKFDPSTVEHELVAKSNDISDALMFGDGELSPGVLIFTAEDMTSTPEDGPLERIWDVVRTINDQNPGHVHIQRRMIKVMPFEAEPLEKSSKGTVMRQRATEKYSDAIRSTYEAAMQFEKIEVSDDQLANTIKSMIEEAIGIQALDADQDLFTQGVDSIMSMQIRHRLRALLPENSPSLPETIVQDSMTVNGLAATLHGIRCGKVVGPAKNGASDKMQEFIKRFSQLDHDRPVESMIDGFTTLVEEPGKTILLTGATGSLGSFVLYELAKSSKISHVYVLVRGSTQHAAEERVAKALAARKLLLTDDLWKKITVMQCKLSDPDLGIPFLDYNELQSSVDIVMHLAWSVNFLISLESFQPHFQAMQNLLNLCLSSTKLQAPRFVFCSSVAAVSNWSAISTTKENVPEQFVCDLGSCGITGYARSKLTAEMILAVASNSIKSLRGRITIVRVGQLSASTSQGVWNAAEAYPQMLATAKVNGGLLPDLGVTEPLTWVPVDVAAKAFVEGGLREPQDLGSWPTEHATHKYGMKPDSTQNVFSKTSRMADIVVDTSAAHVLHLINPDTTHTFKDLLLVLQKVTERDSTDLIKIVSPTRWLDSLEELLHTGNTSEDVKRLLRLLPFWREAYGQRTQAREGAAGAEWQGYNLHNSLLAMPSLACWLGKNTIEGRGDSVSEQKTVHVHNELLNPEHVEKVWQWVAKNLP